MTPQEKTTPLERKINLEIGERVDSYKEYLTEAKILKNPLTESQYEDMQSSIYFECLEQFMDSNYEDLKHDFIDENADEFHDYVVERYDEVRYATK